MQGHEKGAGEGTFDRNGEKKEDDDIMP